MTQIWNEHIILNLGQVISNRLNLDGEYYVCALYEDNTSSKYFAEVRTAYTGSFDVVFWFDGNNINGNPVDVDFCSDFSRFDKALIATQDTHENITFYAPHKCEL